MINVEEELNERINGDYSDDDDGYAQDFDN